jgi:hypothetical protein
MNRNTDLALIFSIALMVSLVINMNVVRADSTEPLTFSSGLTLYSPVNKTYTSNLLQLNLTFGSGAGLQTTLNYCIDGKYQGPIPLTFNSTTGFEMIGLGYALVPLPELSNGPHVLTVNVEAYLNDYHGANPPGAPFKPVAPNSSNYVASWVHIVYFTMNATVVILSPTPTSSPNPTSILEPTVSFTQWHTSSPAIQTPANRLAHIPPIVEIVSPENQTIFQISKVTLTVDVASYFCIIDSVYYQADWQEGIHQIFGVQPNYEDALNATITTTFTQIPNGNHTIEISANTHDNMHTLSTVTFSVHNANPTPTPTLVPTSTATTPPTTTSTVPELSWLTILPLLTSLFAVAIFLKNRQVKKP